MAAALFAAGLISHANALDHAWFGGNGNWDDASNWAPLGVPGSADAAILSGGTVTLSFARAVGELRFNGGILSSAGALTVANDVFPTGNGQRALAGGVALNTAGATTWSGNTSAGGNDFNFNGSATINNTGAWTDANASDAALGSGSSGTKVFNNAGYYVKTGTGTTDIFAAVNNTGSVSVTAGRLSINGSTNATSTGSFNIASGAILSFGRNGNSGGLATLDGATFSGTGQLPIDANTSSGNDVRQIGTSSHAGQLAVANGSFAVDGTFGVGSFAQTGGAVAGTTGTLTVDGPASFTGGDQTGTSTTQFNGTLALSGNGSRSLSAGRIFNTAGATNWSGNSVAGGKLAINYAVDHPTADALQQMTLLQSAIFDIDEMAVAIRTWKAKKAGAFDALMPVSAV